MRDVSRDNQRVLGTLANGISVVEALGQGPTSVQAVAEGLNLPRQTVYRIISTLVACGWLNHYPGDTYGLTARFWGLCVGSFDAIAIRDRLSAEVGRLAIEHGETVHLSVYDRGTVIYIDKRDGSQPIRSYTTLGSSAPCYCVATGKALLAYQTEDEINQVCQHLEARTDTTIVEPRLLRDELEAIRTSGFAVNRGEYRVDVGGVAIPILAPQGDAVAALGFSGPCERIRAKEHELVGALRSVVAAW
jgi:IclR family KDG regulon transcriptional repressor